MQPLSVLGYSALHLTFTENSYSALSCHVNNIYYNQLEELIELQELQELKYLPKINTIL